MARKLRIEHAGAIYHVLNRGNYRAHSRLTAECRQGRHARALYQLLTATSKT